MRMKRQYRLALIYSDGSVHRLDTYPNREKLEMTVRAMGKKPSVKYCCEEWAESQTSEDIAGSLKSVTVYEV